jgi:hypothetical protein
MGSLLVSWAALLRFKVVIPLLETQRMSVAMLLCRQVPPLLPWAELLVTYLSARPLEEHP